MKRGLVVAATSCLIFSVNAHAGREGVDAFRAFFAPGAAYRLDNERARRYIALFDRDVEKLIAPFDFEKGLLDLDGPMPPPEIASLDRHARKRYTTSGKYAWLYSLGRSSASAIGNFALAWALPESKFHGDERFYNGVIRGLETYLENQLPSGEFAFSSMRFSSVYGTHEMAWRLEPLLAAYLCVRDTLPEPQAQRFHDGLLRAAAYLHETPCSSQSNRGCVWSGVMALAANVFDRPDFLVKQRDVWDWVGRRVYQDSGQVVEGPGPDFNYSYISFRYTFLQRLAADDGELDAKLLHALDWLGMMHDSSGLPMQSVSTRLGNHSPRLISHLLAALEYYARERPYCGTIAEDYLSILENEKSSGATGHGGTMWIAAALYHDPSVTPEPLPDRLLRFEESYAFDVTKYLNVRHGYQTLVLFRGVKELSGLQHWCAEGERPILFGFRGSASGIKAWGIDTARLKVANTRRVDTSDLPTASIDWGGIRTGYVFGDVCTWVFDVAPGSQRVRRWAINRARCATPTLVGQTIRFEKQHSQIEMGPIQPTLEEKSGGWIVRANLSENEPFDWTVFHDGLGKGSREPVDVTLKSGLLTAHLQESGKRYKMLFNAGGGTQSVDGDQLAPLQIRIYAQ